MAARRALWTTIFMFFVEFGVSCAQFLARMYYHPSLPNAALRPSRRLLSSAPAAPRAGIITFSLILCAVCSSFSPLDGATINATSNSYTDVNTAVNTTAARGDTVVVPAGNGTVSWDTNTLTLRKGVFLKGPGRDNLTVTGIGVLVAIVPDSIAIANEETIRVEGFTFNGNNLAVNIITVQGAGTSASKPFRNLAIGNNRLKNTSLLCSGSGAVRTNGQVRGAIFGNIFDRCNVIVKAMGNNDSGQEWANGHFPFAYGNSDNLFFENNTIQFSSAFLGECSGWIETGQGARIAVRYNTWNGSNTNITELWDAHGFQNWPGNGQTGTMIVEYYGNTLINCPSYRIVTHRGSWGLFHNNIFTGANSGTVLQANQYGVGDVGGSGCAEQIPGASGVYRPEINNTYAFNNQVNTSGNIRNMTLGLGGCGVAENSHFWNYKASFDGSTGIGRGTTAPTGNCTVGVAYWKASAVTPTVNPSVIQNGHLYKCLSTNVWTDYYTPYTYPHPLAAGGPPPTPPPTPTTTPSPTPPVLGLTFDATAGVISTPFTVSDSAISQAIQTTDPTQGGRASYTFAVPTAGDYLLSGRVNCPDASSNSLFVNIDAEPTSAMIWNIATTSGFETKVASWPPNTTQKAWTLTAGTHELIIRGREANTVLQHIVLGTAPNAPQGLHVP